MKKKVSVVLCVKDVAHLLKECLISIKKNEYFEIIVIDGNSKDDTVQIAEKVGVDKIISDEGKGLSYARKLGVDNASGNQVLFFGPDNIMDSDFIKKFVAIKEEYGFDVASVQTRVYNPVTFWDFGRDFRWLSLMGKVGPIQVAGTPSLYSKSVFEIATFSEEDFGPSDDTQIAQKLIEGNQKIGLIPLNVYDKNESTFRELYEKFKWYGSGDFYFYKNNRLNWTLKRKVFSLTHPLRQMLFKHLFKAILKLRLDFIIWSLIMTFARYHGWIETCVKRKN